MRSGRACVALPRTGVAQPARMPAADLPVALVGAGGIASTHAAAFASQPGVRLVAICDIDREKAAALAARHPGCQVVADQEAVLASEAAMVSLCTPPFLHASGARAALAAGKHVVLEKPLAGSLAEFDDLVLRQDASGKTVVPVLQNRLGDGPRGLRAVLAAGLAGSFMHGTVETVWRRGSDYYAVPWRGKHATELGGPLTGLAVHVLDLVLGLIPAPQWVQAHAATLVHPIELEDTAALIAGLTGGGWLTATVSVHANRELTRGLLCWQHLQAEFGDAPYGYSQPRWRITSSEPLIQAAIDRVLADLPSDPPPSDIDQLWFRMARIWAAAGRGAVDPAFALATGRPALELISAAYGAARTGERVPLPLAKSHDNYRRLAP